ncbi:MAG: TolB family protein [Cyclobacteriaceae bacterium]
MKNSIIALVLFITGCGAKNEVIKNYRNYISSWSPDGTEALFYSDRNGNWDIFKIGIDDKRLTQITNLKANETEPNWHPSRSEFLFASDESGERKIYLYNLEEGTKRLLIDKDGMHSSPVWSNDGKYVAFLVQQNDLWNLMVTEDGDTTSRTLYTGSVYPGRPTWSTKDEILYSILVDGKETLHLVDMNGIITERIVPGYNSIGNAAISPDGTKVIFDAHEYDSLDSGDGKWEIFVFDRGNSSVTRLTDNETDDWGARWSRDGIRIVYLGLGLNNSGYELFVMSADGSKKEQLTDRKK